jgi:hypothetical protein
VLTALNKLDAGDPEEVLLSSRDGKDLLVVSYADVQRCVDCCFVRRIEVCLLCDGCGAGVVSSYLCVFPTPTCRGALTDVAIDVCVVALYNGLFVVVRWEFAVHNVGWG